ncbi:MAG: hypothetical protein FJW64_02815 [Actinobacteria bacterium]|nr:hypothetical protein [Actinomycetota bacterium]
MTKDSAPAPPSDLLPRAIATLTELARSTRVIEAGTLGEYAEQADFADTAAHVLAAVAANLGFVEQLLAGRQGSRQSSLVRQLITGAAGANERDPLPYRTEPLGLAVDLDDVFAGYGLASLLDVELDGLVDEYEQLDSEIFTEQATAPERALYAHLDSQLSADATVEAVKATIPQLERLPSAVRSRADGTQLARLNELGQLNSRMRRLYDHDQVEYLTRFTADVHAVLVDDGLEQVPVVISYPEGHGSAPDVWIGIEQEVSARALARTTLPFTGSEPNMGLSPADQLRAVGASYRSRAAAL